jgi:hypothetical protein
VGTSTAATSHSAKEGPVPTYQVTAIRADGNDIYRRIEALQIEGTLWPIDKVIDWTRTGVHHFWVQVDEHRVPIILRRHRVSGRYYLTTEGGGFPPNHLLALRPVR